jgi:hypothetical protein
MPSDAKAYKQDLCQLLATRKMSMNTSGKTAWLVRGIQREPILEWMTSRVGMDEKNRFGATKLGTTCY